MLILEKCLLRENVAGDPLSPPPMMLLAWFNIDLCISMELFSIQLQWNLDVYNNMAYI